MARYISMASNKQEENVIEHNDEYDYVPLGISAKDYRF